MNAADDKEKSNKQNTNRLNGIKEDAVAASSTMCPINNEMKLLQPKQNGGSVQNNDLNKYPITNGAYPKVKSCSVLSACDYSGPSVSRKICNEKLVSGKPENIQSELYPRDSDLSLSLRNSDNNNSRNAKNSCNPNEKAACDYDRNSSSEDEECCIYTYKGDSNQMADLPSSFFNLDLLPSRLSTNSRNSSPDMDYLEMDFDPGPSNDRCSSTDSECGERLKNEEFLADQQLLSEVVDNHMPVPVASKPSEENQSPPISPLSTPSPILYPRPHSCSETQSPLPGRMTSPPVSPRKRFIPDSKLETTQPTYCYCVAKKLSPSTLDENFNDGDAGTMIWKEHEAKDKQVNQIGVSACGATAVINALLGLNVQFSISGVKQLVATRYRNETALLPEYLVSRCYAGATHVDMIRALHGASQNTVYARFFHMYPERNIHLSSWLTHWIRKGAVPIMTLNLQNGVRPGDDVPDFWHHQMVYGVSSQGVHLTNPLEVQSESHLWPQLTSPPVMLIKRDDIISRWTPDTDLQTLSYPSRPVWRKLNVLGQVVNVIREHYSRCHSNHNQRFVTIPASYSSGVTLCILRSNPAYDELRLAPELPLLHSASTS